MGARWVCVGDCDKGGLLLVLSNEGKRISKRFLSDGSDSRAGESGLFSARAWMGSAPNGGVYTLSPLDVLALVSAVYLAASLVRAVVRRLTPNAPLPPRRKAA